MFTRHYYNNYIGANLFEQVPIFYEASLLFFTTLHRYQFDWVGAYFNGSYAKNVYRHGPFDTKIKYSMIQIQRTRLITQA